MDGKPRVNMVDLGAFEGLPGERPADGKFTVTSGSGITSAGTLPSTTACAILFQNLPLAKGTYGYGCPPATGRDALFRRAPTRSNSSKLICA